MYLRKRAYKLYSVDYQQLKCLHHPLQIFEMVYIVDIKGLKPLHFVLRCFKWNRSHCKPKTSMS